jgi:hypothetical protein
MAQMSIIRSLCLPVRLQVFLACCFQHHFGDMGNPSPSKNDCFGEFSTARNFSILPKLSHLPPILHESVHPEKLAIGLFRLANFLTSWVNYDTILSRFGCSRKRTRNNMNNSITTMRLPDVCVP